MLLKNGQLVKGLDFRGTSTELLDKLTARELFLIMSKAQQQVNLVSEKFKATELAPSDWSKTVYQPILDACEGDRAIALKLFGVVIKQALIMTPILFSQEGGDDFSGAIYTREILRF